MTAQRHCIFALASVIFAKKMAFSSALYQGNWGHIIIGVILGCLLPDIDHPKSFLGKKLKWFSIPLTKILGHRGFTHSFLAILLFSIIMNISITLQLVFPKDMIDASIISYSSHIIADMFTPFGVPLLWPFNFRFRIPILHSDKNLSREKIFCYIILLWSFLYPVNKKISEFITIDFIKKIFKNLNP